MLQQQIDVVARLRESAADGTRSDRLLVSAIGSYTIFQRRS